MSAETAILLALVIPLAGTVLIVLTGSKPNLYTTKNTPYGC